MARGTRTSLSISLSIAAVTAALISFHLARTADHEIGHLLGLAHAWYGGTHPEEFLENDNSIMGWTPAVMCRHSLQALDEPQLHFRPSNNNIKDLRSTENPFTW